MGVERHDGQCLTGAFQNKEAELAQLLDTLGPIHEGADVKEARNRHSKLKTKVCC